MRCRQQKPEASQAPEHPAMTLADCSPQHAVDGAAGMAGATGAAGMVIATGVTSLSTSAQDTPEAAITIAAAKHVTAINRFIVRSIASTPLVGSVRVSSRTADARATSGSSFDSV
jgi:hypothetical protein